jgi:hypothetical protein
MKIDQFSSVNRTILAVLSLCAFSAAVWMSGQPQSLVRTWIAMLEYGVCALCAFLAFFGGEGIYEPPICKIRWLRWTLKKTIDALEREKSFVEKFNSEITWLQARIRILEWRASFLETKTDKVKQ